MNLGKLAKFLGACAASLVSATGTASDGTNFSDQWWNPNESGWGISVLQQADVIFVDLFVYDTAGNPTWFTAAATQQSDPFGRVTFTGDLNQTSGPWFGGVFNPAFVGYRKVGTLTFDAVTLDTANLTYVVDGVAVSKPITRQLWKFENFNGNYYGGFTYDFTQCANSANNGHVEELGTVAISQAGNASFTISAQTSAHTCTFSGDYSQAGHMGTSQGTFGCTDGLAGTYTAFEMERTGNGMTGRINGQDNFCNFSGRFGGLQR